MNIGKVGAYIASASKRIRERFDLSNAEVIKLYHSQIKKDSRMMALSTVICASPGWCAIDELDGYCDEYMKHVFKALEAIEIELESKNA